MVEFTENYSFNPIPTCNEDMQYFPNDIHHTKQYKSEVLTSSGFPKDIFKSGDNCYNSPDSPLESSKTKPICKFFLRNACIKGDSCSFLHDIPLASKKSVGVDLYNHSRERLFSTSRFWNPDRDFKKYFNYITHFQSDSFPNLDLSSCSYSALNQRNIFTPAKDFAPEADFTTHPYATSNSEAVHMFHFDSDPSQAIRDPLHSTSNAGIANLSHFDAFTGNVMNSSYPTSNIEIVHRPHSDNTTSSTTSIWDFLNPKWNPEDVHVPHSSTITASEPSHENSLYLMSNIGIFHVPYSDSTTVSKETLRDHSSLTSNTETTRMHHSTSSAVSNVSLWNYPSQTLSRESIWLPNSNWIRDSEPVDLLENVSKQGTAYMDHTDSVLEKKIRTINSAIGELNLTNSNSETFILDEYQSDASVIHSGSLELRTDFLTRNSNLMPDLLNFTACPHNETNESVNDMKLDYVQQNATETPKCIDSNEQSTDTENAKNDEKIISSADVVCELCRKNVLEKEISSIYKFGILPNCDHSFCLPCIKVRSRQSVSGFGPEKNKLLRSCPKCRSPFDYFLPSAYWTNSKEEKDKLMSDHLKALKEIPCCYFLAGTCKFGDRCRYLHDFPLFNPQSRRISTDTSDYFSETGSISNESIEHEENPILKRY